MAELGHLRGHQGAEEPALRCRAPPEGRGEPGSTPGGVGGPGGPEKGPLGCGPGAVARLGAVVAGFAGRGCGAPRHGRGGQQLATPDPAHRPHPLALPPEELAAAAVPAPTEAGAQVTATPSGKGLTPSKPGPGPQTTNTGGMGADQRPGAPPQQAQAPVSEGSPPPSLPAVRTAGGKASPRDKETVEATARER